MTPSIAIVGAGMSGLCMAITLRRAGYRDVTVFEKADRLGGTWRDNTYPGLACDVPSRGYQYTFALDPGWSRRFSPGGEILAYLERVAAEHRATEHIEFGTEVVSARFTGGRWRVGTRHADGTERGRDFDFLVSATGVLHHPRLPGIPGLETFAGAAFHSARWDHSVRLRGRRVAVVGNGSTGVQIVTALAGEAAHVMQFQRSAQWIAPLRNRAYSPVTRAAFRRVPALNRLGYRVIRETFDRGSRAVVEPSWQRRLISWYVRRNLARVRDPELRRKLTPDHEPLCRRLIVSSGFYEAVQRPDVSLVTEGIDRVGPRGVVTADGVLHEADVLVLATGFDAHAYLRPVELVGPEGRTLADAWADGPRAYRTVALPGFPNFFMLMGPHSPIGNISLVPIAETQAGYILEWIRRWRPGTAAAPTREATDRFNARMREAMPDTVWATGCTSWYLGADGLPELWPWTPDKHRAMLARPHTGEFEVTRS